MKTQINSERIRALHKIFTLNRGVSKSYCPSEIARNLFTDDWKNHMEEVRRVADELVECGYLIVLQNNKNINVLPSQATGLVRLKRNK